MCTGTPVQLPSNVNMLLRSVSSKTPVNDLVREDSFSGDEINVMRSAVARSQERVHSRATKEMSDMAEDMEERLSKKKKKSPNKIMMLNIAKHFRDVMASPTIQYGDYKLGNENVQEKSPISNMFNPEYSMATTIGRAKYEPDDNGNLHIKDTYNFNRAEKTKEMSLGDKLKRVYELNKGGDNGGGWNPLFSAAHVLGEQYSKPMKIDLQLQHGANGEW